MLSRLPHLIDTVARHYWGDPNPSVSTPNNPRWGTHGSRSVDLVKGTWFDHEADNGGGVVDLIKREEGASANVADILEKTFGLPRDAPPVRTVTTFDYVDSDGTVPYQVLRIDVEQQGVHTKTYRQRRADPSQPGGWIHDMMGITALPYRLLDLIELEMQKVVFIVEGEKCVEAMAGIGLPATTNHGGAGKWHASLTPWFADRKVIIIPDNDKSGEKHVRVVGNALAPVAASVRVLRLPGLPYKGDVADWIARGGTKAKLIELAKQAEPYTPADTPQDAEDSLDLEEPAKEAPFRIFSYKEYSHFPPVEWQIDNVLPARSKTVLFGVSNAFKSFLAIDMACCVATGREWHGNAVKRGPVLYIATEGAFGVGRKRIPAWMAAHNVPTAEREGIHMITGDVILRGDMSVAVSHILAHFKGAPALVVVDVLAGTMDGSESDDEAARDWVKAATQLVMEMQSAMLVVTHSPYSDDGRMRGHSHIWGSFDTRLKADGDKDTRTTTLTVNRHKDHDSTGEWTFRLEEHALDEHPLETSLVPSIVDAQDHQKAAGPKLPPSLMPVWETLLEVVGESGQTPPGFAQIPPGTKAVKVNLWRQTYYSSTALDADARQKAFRRAVTRLEEQKSIGVHADYVWISRA